MAYYLYTRPRQNFFSPYFQPDFKSLAQIPAADGRTAQNIDVCLCHRGFKDFGSGNPFWKFKFQKCPHVFAISSQTVWPTIKVEYSADCWDHKQKFKPWYGPVDPPQAALFAKPLAWPISEVPTKATLPWNKSYSTHQKWMVEVCAGSWYVYQFFKPSNTVLSLQLADLFNRAYRKSAFLLLYGPVNP